MKKTITEKERLNELTRQAVAQGAELQQLWYNTIELPTNYKNLNWQERKMVRNQYVVLQKNKCFYCKGSLDKLPPKKITKIKIDWSYFPANFLQYPIHLQHNHQTGMTEGAVHAYCNAVMWQYEGK